MIPYGRQSINQDDIDAVVEVLKSDFLTQGPQVPRFEKAVADYCGVAHALAVNSATSALHIACMALGIGEGDIVWTSPISFVASSNCALYCGAQVDFVDIDQFTGNMSISALKAKLESARQSNSLPKVVIPVHLSGFSCPMAEISELASHYGFRIIEDASHAIGGQYKGHPVGRCEYSDITVFSFHPVKIITTAEGGMALTQSDELAEKMSLLRSHGITRDESRMDEPPHGPWYYQQQALGFNYRMTELQAALGVSQMSRLDSFVESRQRLANRYDELLVNLPLTLPPRHQDVYSALHLYVVRLKLCKISLTHRQVFEELRAAEIGVNLHYIPIPMQPYYRRLGFSMDSLPQAAAYYSEAISLPLYSDLSEFKQDKVVQVLSSILERK